MVYEAAGGPINNKRYVSTSGGGAQEGDVGEEQMISGEFNTFGPAIACSNGSNMADKRLLQLVIVEFILISFQVENHFMEESSKMILHSQLKI